MFRWLIFFELLLAAVALAASPAVIAEEMAAPPEETPGYVLGVFPFLPSSSLEGVFAPLAAEISSKLGKPVSYRSATTFESFMERLAAGEFDIAHIQPFDYVRIAAAAGYLPVADRREKLYGSFYVKAESPAQSIRDLAGTTVASPPEVAAISYLARIALLELGLTPGQEVTFKPTASHHACLQLVAIGDASACATGQAAARTYEEKTGIAFRPLERFPEAPYTVFVIHSRLPEKDRKAITEVILSTTLAGVSPAHRLHVMRNEHPPFVPITDADFETIRRYWRMIEENHR